MSDKMPLGVALIIPKGNQYLLMKRDGSHGAGLWAVPGGWVELGEDPAKTCVREAKEEVGLLVWSTTLLGYSHDIFPEGVEDVCLWFMATAWDGVPSIVEPHKCTFISWRTAQEIHGMYPDIFFGGKDRLIRFIEIAENRRKEIF